MVDVKEIKHIRAAPFTLMTSSIHAILAFIIAIILILTFGTIAALIPGAGLFAGFIALLGLSIIILMPLTAFFINILYAFVMALVYNLVAAKVGGIKLGMEGDEVKSIPVVALALVFACVGAIFALILGLYMGLAGSAVFSLVSGVIPIAATAANATNVTNLTTIPTGAVMQALSGIWALFWIIIYPIVAFIMTFIIAALFAIFYNVLIPKVGGIKLMFAPVTGNVFELNNIPPVPAALAIAVVMTIFGIIQGLLNFVVLSSAGDAVGGLVSLIAKIISAFVGYFVIVAIVAFLYNFLAPKIGGIKLELE
ncbi:MAG TPA: hypothetical protein VK444_04545 [Methanobacteriaceae archaeon]|nr:hypothetical protein [Methanobacteriaceae archaeon]